MTILDRSLIQNYSQTVSDLRGEIERKKGSRIPVHRAPPIGPPARRMIWMGERLEKDKIDCYYDGAASWYYYWWTGTHKHTLTRRRLAPVPGANDRLPQHKGKSSPGDGWMNEWDNNCWVGLRSGPWSHRNGIWRRKLFQLIFLLLAWWWWWCCCSWTSISRRCYSYRICRYIITTICQYYHNLVIMMIIYCRVDHENRRFGPVLTTRIRIIRRRNKSTKPDILRDLRAWGGIFGTFDRLTDGFRGAYWMECSLAGQLWQGMENRF